MAARQPIVADEMKMPADDVQGGCVCREPKSDNASGDIFEVKLRLRLRCLREPDARLHGTDGTGVDSGKVTVNPNREEEVVAVPQLIEFGRKFIETVETARS